MDNNVIELLLKENIKKTLENDFFNCYSCTRTWSAWGYDTMSPEDFVPFSQGDGAFEDMAKLIFDDVKLGKIFDIDTINTFFENLNYELYYNENIENFSSEYFHEDYFCYISIEATSQKILDLVDFTQTITNKPEEKNVKKLSM